MGKPANKKIKEWMKEAGWQLQSTDDGAGTFTLDLGDRKLISHASFSDIPQYFQFRPSEQLSFPFQTSIINCISAGFGDVGMVDRNSRTSYKTAKGDAGFIIECTDDLIKWAMSIKPEEEIKDLSNYEKEYEDYNHLAALAIVGDVQRLTYLFEKRLKDPGDSPYMPGTLHPSIKPEVIERAVEVAEYYRQHPMDWSAPTAPPFCQPTKQTRKLDA